jgi:hypothetical protein
MKDEELVYLRSGSPIYYRKYCWSLDYYGEPVSGAILDMENPAGCASACNYLFEVSNTRCDVGSY